MSNNQILENEIKDILRKNGFKVTPTKISVLRVIVNSNLPLCANAIYKNLKDDINEATVYRILSAFSDKGILKRVDLRKDSVFFEYNNDHHHHLVCVRCGKIEDFKENRNIENILNQIVERSVNFTSIKEHSLELFGLCKLCN